MCGICGAAALSGRLNPDIRAALPAMTHALSHRGPDGEGRMSDDHVTLGHRRLAIIDRAGGDQPMPNEDRSIWVVFNGEIYNHHALRRELIARGHTFRTTSDTEAIVHAYEEWGTECVKRLDGMFAFAVWDSVQRELLLARDRLGKKPLFYAVLGGALHFASEIKSLYCSPAWDGTIDTGGLEAYLSLGYFLAPHTIYRHVRKLEPAHYLVLRKGQITTAEYWDVERFDDDRGSADAIAADVSEKIREAVSARLESEVPLGAFLSGGIDSGLVVSYMSEAMNQPVVTTSVGFGERGHNELPLAALTARRWATDHSEQIVKPRLDGIVDVIVDAFDEPFADSSAIPTYFVSGAARQRVTVALTGDGGDETFGGYGFRYVPHLLESRVRKVLPPGSGRVLEAVSRSWPRDPRLPQFLRLGPIFGNLALDAEAAYYADLCFLKPPLTRTLLGLPAAGWRDSALFDAVTGPYRRCPSADPVQKAQYADLKVYLPNDVLVKVDRMSMAHALEIRCPLLDHHVVERAFAIPRREKLRRLEAKSVLRRIARQRLPPELLRAPKHGFTAPVGEWLAGPHADAYREEVLRPGSAVSSWLDLSLLRRMFDAHRLHVANYAHALWATLLLERWARREAGRRDLRPSYTLQELVS
jgi:asparagine synthase (glutamine-hydrolysing)